MWIFGGMSELWSSTDGVNWTKELASVPFSYLLNSGAVVLNGKIYVMLGMAETTDSEKSDVWVGTVQ